MSVQQDVTESALKPRVPHEKADRNEAVMAALTRPGAKVAAVAREFKISSKMVRKIRDRHKARIIELREVRMEDLAKKIENVADRLADDLLSADFAGESPVTKATAFGILVDKALLLRGRPTQIVGGEVRHKLDELAPALLAEMRRRGMEAALPAPMVDITPVPAKEPEVAV